MNLPKTIGSIFAHIQSTIDDIMAVLFKKLKKSGKEEPVEIIEPDTPVWKTRLKKGARGLARFIGEMGDSYYKTYEELKQKK